VPVLVSDNAIHPPHGPYITIQVNGQQYLWRYSYLNYGKAPDGLDDPYSSYQMVVPTNTTVVLKIVSQDVVHSWWIPDLGGKYQAVPGYTNWGWFKVSKPGNYYGQCAFICGLGHARMKAEVTALPPKQFLAWIAHQKQAIASANATQAKARSALQNQTGAAAVGGP
jgi:cytochrome c oxidase subunit 2